MKRKVCLTMLVIASVVLLSSLANAQNQPPVADPNGPYDGIVGQLVQFDGSGSFDPDGDTLIYLWDFGDGTPPPFPSQDPTATHTYDAVGTYTVVLAVTDGVN